MTPTRELFWNISYHNLLYPIMIIALIIFGYGFYHRFKYWQIGKQEEITGSFGQRFKSLLIYAFGQARVIKEKYPGLMHLLIFVGIVLLFLGTVTESFEHYLWQLLLGQPLFLVNNFYLIFSLVLDIAGAAAIVGIVMALFRRYVQRPERLNSVWDNAILLLWLLFVLVSGFLVEGARIAALKPAWEIWSPVGNWIAPIFAANGQVWHRWLWWLHMLFAFGLIAYLPFSRLKHIFISGMNIFLRSLEPPGALKPIDIEKAEIFGARKINDFTIKNLIDLDACTSCGRCQDQCPAFASGKPLSPKKIILDLLDNLNEQAPKLIKGGSLENEPALIGSAVQAEEIWACTTCSACREACPVFIEHIEKIVELRRDRTLTESDFPPELNQTFKGMENNFNPWGIGFSSRSDWAEGQNLKRLDQGETAEYLWFVGCAGSFDDRIKKVSLAFARVLSAAGVEVGILGPEEKCCGETARRLGNEYLAQTLMEMNIQLFNELGIKKIITFCPHCFNTLKYEYPQFSGNYEVLHSTELLSQLIKAGKISLDKNGKQKITYHDSCYLGRYSKIYQPPREIIKRISPHLIELGRNRERSFCCGAGGGRMWLEETIGERINHLRTEEVINSGAEKVVTCCPYCLTMLSDGLKDKEATEKVAALDIIELADQAMREHGRI